MDSATRLKRHTQLWKEGETSVRRIGIGGALFAVIILLTVIEPYHIEAGNKPGEIRRLESEKKALDINIEKFTAIQGQFESIQTGIANEPWTDEIEDLKTKFSSGLISDPQGQSNDALKNIAVELRRDIVAPLRRVTDQLPGQNELAAIPDNIDSAIEGWLVKYENVPWWATRDAKDEAAEAIGEDIAWVVRDASIMADDFKSKLEAAAQSKTDSVAELDNALKGLRADLKNRMDRVLPSWARGILDVDHLLILFPWLLAGIAVYLIATALRTSRHFRAMADGEGWTDEERRDPLLSSAWTVTPRGTGSVATFLTYVLVFGVLGVCLYRSQHPPVSPADGSVQVSVDFIAGQSSQSALIAYGLFVVAIALVISLLFRGRHKSDSISDAS